MTFHRAAFVLCGSLAAVLALAGPGPAATLGDGEVFSSILAQPVATPSPVRGADGRVHLAYELLVVDPSRMLVTLDGVTALAPGGTTLGSMTGDALAKMTTLNGGGKGTTLPPGGSAWVLMDVTFAEGAPLPTELDDMIVKFPE